MINKIERSGFFLNVIIIPFRHRSPKIINNNNIIIRGINFIIILFKN